MAKQSSLAKRLRREDPAAIVEFRLALRRAGSVRGAAKRLGLSARTVEGWIQEGRPGFIQAAVDQVKIWKEQQ